MILLICGAIILGGLFQILFGLLKLGKYITLVPYSVVSGFMSGIGFIIINTELGNLLGIGKVKGTWNSLLLVANKLSSNINIVDGSGLFGGEIVDQITNINGAAIGVSLMTIAIVFITPKRITNIIPSPLLALLIVAPISVFLFNDDKLVSLGKDALPRIGEIPTGFPTLLPFKDALTDPVLVSNLQNNLSAIVQGGIVLAALGAIDSLLTSLVADNITQTRHDSNRELIGQGIGNAIGGFFGGLPGAEEEPGGKLEPPHEHVLVRGSELLHPIVITIPRIDQPRKRVRFPTLWNWDVPWWKLWIALFEPCRRVDGHFQPRYLTKEHE